jgi:hypothetical protein
MDIGYVVVGKRSNLSLMISQKKLSMCLFFVLDFLNVDSTEIMKFFIYDGNHGWRSGAA